jgi:hypothetical protein
MCASHRRGASSAAIRRADRPHPQGRFSFFPRAPYSALAAVQRIRRIEQELTMNVDRTSPEAGGPDLKPAKQGNSVARQAVDWFALTEDNLSPPDGAPAPPAPAAPIEAAKPVEALTLEVPSACSIGGLRP